MRPQTNPRRWTIRARLTLLYGGLFVVAGALLLALTYLLTAHVLPQIEVNPPHPSVTWTGGTGAPQPPDHVAPTVAPPTPDQGVGGWQEATDRRQLMVASVVALAVMGVIALGLGWLMAGRMLRPLRAMAATARAMSARDLHQRLDRQGPNDEIKDLADTFDGLLGRLEASFAAQRQFVANASHELRTPITLQRSLIEVALANQDAGAEQLRAACRRVLAACEHQEQLIEALLVLARGHRGIDRRDDMDLAEIARRVLDVQDAGDVQVVDELSPATVAGDPDLVERMAANLVDNALRYNTAGGRVTVRTGSRDGRSTLQVANTGPVVPPDTVDQLLAPFQRGAAGASGADGVGLGLSIVAAVAAAHDADLTVVPQPMGGLDVRVAFPSP